MTRDAGLRADPQAGVWHPTHPMVLAFPQRRVTGARWLEPLLVIRRPDNEGRWFGNESAKVRTAVPDLRRTCTGTYRATFEAKASGRLHIGANDALVPFLPQAFDGRNRGAAVVEVTPVDNATPAPLPERCRVSRAPPAPRSGRGRSG